MTEKIKKSHIVFDGITRVMSTKGYNSNLISNVGIYKETDYIVRIPRRCCIEKGYVVIFDEENIAQELEELVTTKPKALVRHIERGNSKLPHENDIMDEVFIKLPN